MLPTNLTHIFQIPMEWLEAVDAACFRSAPGTLLSRRDLADGGWCFDVDTEAMADFAVKSTAGSYPSMAQFNSLSQTVAGLSVLDPETVAAIQRLVEEIGTANILTTAAIGTTVAPVAHQHAHTDITDWATATGAFIETSSISNWGETAGLGYAGSAPVCCTNHGHVLSDVVDLDTQTDLVTIATDQTINSVKRLAPGKALWFSAANGYIWQQTETSALTLRGMHGIVFNADANYTALQNHPTVEAGNTTSKAVATCGWVNSTIPVSEFDSPVSVVQSLNYNSTTGVLAFSSYTSTYEGGVLQTATADADTEVVTLPPESNVSATTVPIVTGITWNGATISMKSRNITITRGVVTAWGNESTTTIDTPVAYNP